MAFRSETVSRYWSYLSHAVRTVVLRREEPYLFILVVNDKCNLKCFYCESRNTGTYDLSWQSVRSFLLDARKRGNRALLLTGGEPMLHKEMPQIVAALVKRKKFVYL